MRSALLLLSVWLALTALCQSQEGPRRRLLMDAGWQFQAIPAPRLNDSVVIKNWRVRSGLPQEAAVVTAVDYDTSGPGWEDAASGRDIFGGKAGFAWYRAILPRLKKGRRYLYFAAVDDNATVYLNGTKLLHHEGWHIPFEVPLDAVWSESGPNVLSVLVEYAQTTPLGGITDVVTLRSAAPSQNNSALGGWRTVHLPHDYVVESAFDPKGDPSRGSLIPTAGRYQKTFDLPASDKGKSLWLDFDGVYRDSTVSLNGIKLGRHLCGYTPFRYDIAAAARYGAKNVLSVEVNAQRAEGWWYEGGGIYRHVWLTVADPVHVAPWGVFVSSDLPDPKGPATITVKTKVTGLEQIEVVSHIYDSAGNLAGSVAGPAQAGSQKIQISHPLLWSIGAPRLYRLHTQIKRGDHILDSIDTSFGIRSIRFDADKGFFLNGQPLKIKGTCNHQDFIGVGVAMPDSLLYWRIKKLKEMGSNAYRCAHNPPSAELLDACDRLGMLVTDENRHLGDSEAGKASPGTPYANLSEVQSMVLRDRNHPSVIMWSMCNEEGIQATAAAARIFKAMKTVVDRADGTRPVTCAMNGGYESAVGITSVEDIQGINYLPKDYDSFHRAHPQMPLYASETSSEVGTRGVYDPATFQIDGITYGGSKAESYVSAYDINAPSWAQTAEAAWQPIADRDFVAGGYVWTGFDYKGEPTPFGWPAINSFFGIMDMCGFPKDNYYYYKAAWGDRPLVHLLPHWNWPGQEGRPIDVWAFSNADRVELFLNGASLSSKAMIRNGHLAWSVPYQPGRLEAKAYRGDRLVASDRAETTGAPASLRLRSDRKQLSADGEDVTMIEVAVVDDQGRVVPTAADEIRFSLTGAGQIAGVGNGNPTDHDPDRADHRRAFQGLCMVIVKAGEKPGTIHLSARAKGLKSSQLDFTCR